jgi:hypothetical protein
MVFGDDFVTGTKIAQGLTKWQMNVDGQGWIVGSVRALIQVGSVSLVYKCGVKPVRRRVGGIAGPQFVEPAD